MPSEAPANDSYIHLNGRWHEYHITQDTSIHSEPFWLRGECHLNIKKGCLVEGFHRVTHHPKSPLKYEVVGEIRNGHMTLTENCIQDTSESFIVVYPNLLSENILIGIWLGFDWQHRQISGPIVLSREEMNIAELNKKLTAEELKHSFKGEKIDKLFG